MPLPRLRNLPKRCYFDNTKYNTCVLGNYYEIVVVYEKIGEKKVIWKKAKIPLIKVVVLHLNLHSHHKKMT